MKEYGKAQKDKEEEKEEEEQEMEQNDNNDNKEQSNSNNKNIRRQQRHGTGALAIRHVREEEPQKGESPINEMNGLFRCLESKTFYDYSEKWKEREARRPGPSRRTNRLRILFFVPPFCNVSLICFRMA
ncbi:hypothetical protein E2C01_095307 [Portunus trituberculatus]|uniref:Uncharacterized protein n=1 Tax=Portunus trituberculatus TaxID=210409 RepID=A0A5B7K5F6_PORTR|nr:hypothetical protein [Portunus trituberculatus]